MADSDFRTDTRQWLLKTWADRQQKDVDALKKTGRPYSGGMIESAWTGMTNPALNFALRASEQADPAMKGHGMVRIGPLEVNEAEQVRMQALKQAKDRSLDAYRTGKSFVNDSNWQTVRGGSYPVSGWGR